MHHGERNSFDASFWCLMPVGKLNHLKIHPRCNLHLPYILLASSSQFELLYLQLRLALPLKHSGSDVWTRRIRSFIGFGLDILWSKHFPSLPIILFEFFIWTLFIRCNSSNPRYECSIAEQVESRSDTKQMSWETLGNQMKPNASAWWYWLLHVSTAFFEGKLY